MVDRRLDIHESVLQGSSVELPTDSGTWATPPETRDKGKCRLRSTRPRSPSPNPDDGRGPAITISFLIDATSGQEEQSRDRGTVFAVACLVYHDRRWRRLHHVIDQQPHLTHDVDISAERPMREGKVH